MNSSQVSGKGQFAQAVRLTFKEGMLAPYKVITAGSTNIDRKMLSILIRFLNYIAAHFFFSDHQVVGPSSITAWFLQYSVMGFAFQFVDHALSNMLGVKPVYYGSQLMEAPPSRQEVEQVSFQYRMKDSAKTLIAPILAASLESCVSNRAEVQRYYGKQTFAEIEAALVQRQPGLLRAMTKSAGPALFPSVMRNVSNNNYLCVSI